MKCRSCGAALDLTMESCPACGAEVELGRLTGILGIVCRACDAYNDPGARACAGCGKPLGKDPEPTPPPPSPAPPAPGPVVRSFQKGGGQATRFIPAAAVRAAAGEPPALAPGPLPRTCPRCGAPAGAGSFCAQCGQALGDRSTQAFPAPRPAPAGPTAAPTPGRARLILLAGAGAEGATYPLEADAVVAGRAGRGVTFPDDPCLAPHHATFLYRAGALHVRDEGAPGGTFLRLRGVPVALRAGDCFAVGDRLLRFAGPLPPPPPVPADGTRRLGAPRPAFPAVVLEECLEGGATGHVFVRSGPSVTIGRTGCAVSLDGAGTPDAARGPGAVSQAHAELILEGDGTARLRDLGSSSGTFVRLPPHAERELRDGDVVRIGRELLRVSTAEA